MADRTPPTVGVFSETAPLLACITCSPGDEFDRMAPQHIEALARDESGVYGPSSEYLLFDDLVLLPLLQAEHAQLVAAIRSVTGPRQSYDLRQLLQHVLAEPKVAAAVLDEVVELERQLGMPVDRVRNVRKRLGDLGPADLVAALMSGADPETDQDLLAWPMPNWLFSRDVWAVVGNAVVMGYPRPRARKRDGILARTILRHHPLFRDTPLVDLRPSEHGIAADEMAELRCVEGGDVLVVARDLVLIGIGERTTEEAALTLARLLKDRGVGRVLGVHLPTRRATMHLDTVFTLIDADACLAYTPVFDAASEPGLRVRVVDLAEPERELGCDLPKIVGEYLGHPLDVVLCGNGDPRAASREQWSDGANAFCLGPGRILLYQRNSLTMRALNRAGFEVVTPEQLVANVDLYMAGHRRVVVALTGAELSRGRGGPRCLTLPIARAG